jgi:hypothetical protein
MALDASTDTEHASIGSLLGQLLKPSQEQIVLLLMLVLLMLFSVTLRDSPPSIIRSI